MKNKEVINMSLSLVGLVKTLVDIDEGAFHVSKEMKEAMRDCVNELCSSITQIAYKICPYDIN